MPEYLACDVGWIIFPVPLGEDRTARLHLPNDLTATEAEKIARAVKALANPST